MSNIQESSNFLFYSSNDGKIKIQVIIDNENETVLATQKSMSEIFNTTRENITIHLRNIFESGELQEVAVSKYYLLTASDGKDYRTKFYNLDVIIAVGYRVNSYQATQFRIWATKILKEYLIKGFTLDDERLKQGQYIFGKDYFDELLERIREIRASERRFYQKVADLYAQGSIDYDPEAKITHDFYSTVQNKLHWAITKMTAAEIVAGRANSSKKHMGLTTWKNSKNGGKILKSDVSIAKNYLEENEIKQLNRLVELFLNYAELQAERKIPMKMADWASRLDSFLKFNEYELLYDSGKISHELAKNFAEKQYDKFRVIQDIEYEFDFDKTVKQIHSTSKLPKEEDIIELDTTQDEENNDFDINLKGLLGVPPPKKDNK